MSEKHVRQITPAAAVASIAVLTAAAAVVGLGMHLRYAAHERQLNLEYINDVTHACADLRESNQTIRARMHELECQVDPEFERTSTVAYER